MPEPGNAHAAQPGAVSVNGGCRDRGSAATEIVLVMPLLMVLMLFAVGGGRFVSARLDVDEAAHEAARAASLARSPGAATAAAQQTATAALAAAGLACPQVAASVDATDDHPGGRVSVTVACTVSLSGLTGVPMPGQHTVRSTSTSVIDTYTGQDAP